MFQVYVLWSSKLRKRYVGSAQNAQERLHQHNQGRTPFNRTGIPWVWIHTESYESRSTAYRRERFLKSGVGRNGSTNSFLAFVAQIRWKGARVVESAGLENRCGLRATVGSNPTPSAEFLSCGARLIPGGDCAGASPVHGRFAFANPFLCIVPHDRTPLM